jgi:hypothetical protein
VVDVVPANAMKERMVFDSTRTSADISQAVGSVDGAKAEDDISGSTREGGVGGECDRFVEDSVEGQYSRAA